MRSRLDCRNKALSSAPLIAQENMMPECTLKAARVRVAAKWVGSSRRSCCDARAVNEKLTLSRQSEPTQGEIVLAERGRALMNRLKLHRSIGSEQGQQNRRGRGRKQSQRHNPLARSFESMGRM